MTVRLLHVSDLEGAFDAPERLGRLAGLIRQRRTDETLLVGTGDALGPSVPGLYADGNTYDVGLSRYFVETEHAIDAVGAEHVVTEHGSEHEALVAYARKVGIDGHVEGRIERV